MIPEPPRGGEGGNPCRTCDEGLRDAVWADDRWKLIGPREAAIPMVLLEPLAHLDLSDLDEEYAAELGVLTVRVERVLMALGGVGRVHVVKWGDGGSHLHVWFFARPEGLLQLRGSSLSDWVDCLPAMPADEWQDLLDAVATDMAARGAESYPGPNE